MAQNPHVLDTPIEFLKGVGPQRAESLQKELAVFLWSWFGLRAFLG